MPHGGYYSRQVPAAVEVIPADKAAATLSGVGVDMAGWDGVIFEATIGTIDNGGTFDMRVVECNFANFSGQVNIAGAAITQVPNTTPNIMVAIDVYRPGSSYLNRYIRAVATVATNNVRVGITSRRYRAQGRTPVDLPNNYQVVVVAQN